MNPIKNHKHHIRQHLRKQRNSLSPLQQIKAAKSCAQKSIQLAAIQNANNIALYLKNDAELDPQPLIEALWKLNKCLFLPVIKDFTNGLLHFAPYFPNSPMTHNKYGIAEPITDQSIAISSIDVIFIPLVGFDEDGNRLGMGGGFYDRSLAGISSENTLKVGLAYQQQKIDSLPSEDWDQPLDMIITESTIYQP